MYRLFFLFIGLLCFDTANSYVVLQRNQNDNSSKVDVKHKAGPMDSRKSGYKQADSQGANSLESVVLAIDTGVKQLMSGQTRPDIIDTIANILVDFAKNSADPIYRTKGQEYDIKPEIIHFRSDKPSVMFEINSKSIINVLKDVLQSKTIRKYMDKFTKEAAVVYRAIRREIEKSQRKNLPN